MDEEKRKEEEEEGRGSGTGGLFNNLPRWWMKRVTKRCVVASEVDLGNFRGNETLGQS